MNNTILILGATGNIGTFLVDELKKRRANIIAGVPGADVAKMRGKGIKSVAVDFSDTASLDKAMMGVDTLFMLVPDAEQMEIWASNIINAAKNNYVECIVRSSFIDARSFSPYKLFKIHGRIDDEVRESGVPHVIVRPNEFMQNFAVSFADTINSDDAFYFTRGAEKVSYIDARDVARVHAAILMEPSLHRNNEYLLTGPAALSSDEIAGILSAVAGRSIRYIPLSDERYKQGLRARGMSEWMIDVSMGYEQHVRDGRQAQVSEDVQKIIGVRPGSFNQFARDYAHAWQKIPAKI